MTDNREADLPGTSTGVETEDVSEPVAMIRLTDERDTLVKNGRRAGPVEAVTEKDQELSLVLFRCVWHKEATAHATWHDMRHVAH